MVEGQHIVGVKINGLTEARNALKAVDHFIKNGDRKMYEEVKDVAIKVVNDRTDDGQDIDGRLFKPYSKSYSKKKHGGPDLKVSGDMRGAIKGKADAKQAVIAVEGGPGSKLYDIALVHNEGGRSGRLSKPFTMPKREFFGIRMDQEIKKLRDVFQKFIDAFIDRLNR